MPLPRNALYAPDQVLPDPNNPLAGNYTLADAADWHRQNLADTYAAVRDPQTWTDAARQYRNALLMGSIAPGAKGLGLDAQAMNVLRDMTPGFRAFHGSPHSFDQFSSDKIGTGEGAQAYGHGLYLADDEAVARSYRDNLAPMDLGQSLENKIRAVAQDPSLGFPDAIQEAIHRQLHTNADMKPGGADGLLSQWQKDGAVTAEQAAVIKQGFDQAVKPPGHMYEVNVAADPAHFLDWDKPLSEQSPHVQQAIGSGDGIPAFHPGTTGREIWQDTHGSIGRYDTSEGRSPAEEAARRLQAAGIPGIRYLDRSSRAGGEGTRNSVIFDPATIAILRKYGIAGLMAGGAAAASGQPQQ